jgi:hypothetical protein
MLILKWQQIYRNSWNVYKLIPICVIVVKYVYTLARLNKNQFAAKQKHVNLPTSFFFIINTVFFGTKYPISYNKIRI